MYWSYSQYLRVGFKVDLISCQTMYVYNSIFRADYVDN